MSSKNNNSDLFNEIKTALDALPGPDKLNTLSRIEVDLIRDRLRKLYDLLSGLEGTEHTVEQVEEKTIESTLKKADHNETKCSEKEYLVSGGNGNGDN